ncbi:MAG TPA: SRPBCC family protein [Solirubrobacteraceae bacterium]|nr:SRPBCC family protein [Solirubrobacteraceae bacterium]
MGVFTDLRGAATRVVPTPVEECFALLAAVDRYPDWYPEAVRDVDVLERDPAGRPQKARTHLHLSWGPVVKEFDLVFAVALEPSTAVSLTKVSDAPSQQRFDVAWRLGEQRGTRLALDLRATLDVPRFLPLGGIGDAIANGFVGAAARALAPAAPA